MDIPAEIMECDISELNEFLTGVGFGVESSDILNGENPPLEMVTDTSEAVNPIMPIASTVNTSATKVNVDQQTDQRGRKRHRHSQQQIQEMESFFKQCPHPDENQRKELALALGMDPIQIKFWFQNKRTQIKAINERQDNMQLRNENEKLKKEILKYKEALASSFCPACGGPSIGEVSQEEHNRLKLENARLKEENARISAIAAKFAKMPLTIHTPPPLATGEVGFDVPPLQGDVGNNNEVMRAIAGPTEAEKPVVTELALSAMDELLQMAQMNEPLWVSSVDPNIVVLDKQEYTRFFCRRIIDATNNLEGFKTEASRESAIVKINYTQLLEAFMNTDRWATMFSNIVSNAVTLGVVSIGVAGNYDGAFQVICADFQVPAPQVATRKYYFTRYCKKNVDGTWAVVDVSIDRYLCINPVGRYMRKPSGCVIEELSNGYSKVTWVEHIELDNDYNEIVGIYKPLLDSGLAFGAKRWITTLDQQCERIACSMSINVPPATNDNMVIITPDGKKCILKLAERMVISYMCGVSCLESQNWKVLSGTGVGADDIRLMIRKVLNEPGMPSGILLSAATSFWLPLEPKMVFDFLHDERTRTEWDILSSSSPVTEVARITYGREISNSVSLFKGANWSQSKMMILQESITNPTGSYLIYAPVDITPMTLVFRGGDPKYVSLLPSGLAILPDGPPGTSSGGSLLTISFQILVNSVPTATLSPASVTTMKKLVTGTVDKIKNCLFKNRM